MTEPTTEETKVLLEFRREVVDMTLEVPEDEQTDIRFLRWLRAREMNIPAAVNMLKKSLDFRKEHDIGNILRWEPPSNYAQDYKYILNGRDKEGRPRESQLWLRYMDQMYVKIDKCMKESSAELGREVTQYFAILDVANFSYAQLVSLSNIESMMEYVRRCEGNYPETVFKGFVVNVSKVYMMMFQVTKRFMTKRTIEKLQLFSATDDWKSELLHHVEPSQLPVEYGGTQA